MTDFFEKVAVFTDADGDVAVDVALIAGTATDVDSGTSGPGTQRVTVATDDVVSIDDGGGSITVDGPLTDTQLRATPVPVSGTVEITNDAGNAIPVSATTAANAAANPLFAQLSDGTAVYSASNPFPVTSDASPGTLVTTQTDEIVDLAANQAATDTLDSTIITSGDTGYLRRCLLSSSVDFLAEIGTWDGTTFTPIHTVIQQGGTFDWKAGDNEEVSIVGDANNTFRVEFTNLDKNRDASMYASFVHTEVAP